MVDAQSVGINLIVFNFALVIVCVAVSILSVFINESDAWYWKSLRSFINSHIHKGATKMTVSRALLEERFEDLAIALQGDAKRYAQQLDRHMIWLSAGAIYLIMQFRGSGEYAQYLVFSFVYFVFCIGAVVSSYFFQHEAMLRAGKAPRAAARVMDIIDTSFPKVIRKIESAPGYVSAASWWNYLRWQIILTRMSSFLLVIFNGLAYFSFLVGMVSFTMFVVLSR